MSKPLKEAGEQGEAFMVIGADRVRLLRADLENDRASVEVLRQVDEVLADAFPERPTGEAPFGSDSEEIDRATADPSALINPGEAIALVPTDAPGHARQWVDADGTFYSLVEHRPTEEAPAPPRFEYWPDGTLVSKWEQEAYQAGWDAREKAMEKLRARAEVAEKRGLSCLDECERYAKQVVSDKALIARLVGVLTFASTATERTQAWMRKNGVVFKKEGGHWEGVAFSVYTDLVEVAEQARAVLASVKEAGG